PGEPGRSDALRESTESPGPAGVAGPRHHRPRLRSPPPDPRPGDEQGVRSVQPLGRAGRCTGAEAIRSWPAQTAHADANGRVAAGRYHRPETVCRLETGRV